MSGKILVAIDGINEEHKKIIEKAGEGREIIYTTPSNVNGEILKDIEIIIGNISVDNISKASNLKFIQLESAGADKYINCDFIKDNNIILSNATGSYGVAIGEYMVGAVLYMMKNFDGYRKCQKEHSWTDLGQVKSIYGSKVLILGLGDIGGSFAKIIKTMGGYTIGVRRKDTRKPEFIDELYMTEDIDKLIPYADIIAMSLPGTPETYHIIDERRLKLMKKDAFIINVGRGNAIDTKALVDVMNSGHIAGAFLDVTEIEPLPSDSNLWDVDNIFITPHVSGGHHIKETLDRIVNISAENICNYINGKDINNIVDFKTGYKTLK